MIVKKLSDVSGGCFPGARYNEMKVASGVACLMAMENVSEALRHNVETLHNFGLDASVEVERYLKERSKTYGNTRTSIRTAIEKICGRGEFKGTASDTVFCGKWDTRL